MVLETTNVVTPPVRTPRQGFKWLETYTPPPHNKQTLRRCRLTLLDGILAVSRRLRDGMMLDCIAIGEGCWVTAAMLSKRLREAAYKERHVATAEQMELEEAIGSLAQVILFAPVLFPNKTYLLF